MRIALLALGVALITAAAAAFAQGGALIDGGKKAFVSEGCYGCHTVGKFGTPIGPDLSYVGVRYPEPYLVRWLRDPASQRPSAHMPKLELSEEQVKALAAYLSSLR
jgi:mono/diheme cytochrome c family protein